MTTYRIYAGNDKNGITTQQKCHVENLAMYYLTHGYDSVKIDTYKDGKVTTKIKTRVN